VEKIKKLTLCCAVLLMLSGCLGSNRPYPVNTFQKALDRMPKQIMSVPGRTLWMKAFVFNNIKLSAKSRNISTWPLADTEEIKDWLLAMGHNVGSATDAAVDLGNWRHTEMLNPTSWDWNCYDVPKDHEVIKSEAPIQAFITWMERHNFEVKAREPAIVLSQAGFHRDSVVFGSGTVTGTDGVTFINREVPEDGTIIPAFEIYSKDGESLLAVPEILELTGRMPDDIFTGFVCKLESSISNHNQITIKDDTGMSGVPLTADQTIEAIKFGRPKTLTWFSCAHLIKNNEHGLSWEFLYDSEEEAKKDLPNLKQAIETAKGRFTNKSWWYEDLHLTKPEITQDGKYIKIWASFNIAPEIKEKIRTLNMTKEERKELWFEVRALFDLQDKFLRRDYGILWQNY
jgi:hypothetical protein